MASWLQRTRERLESLILRGASLTRRWFKRNPSWKPSWPRRKKWRAVLARRKATVGTSHSQKIAIVAGILLIGVSVYGLVRVLQSPAALEESKAPPPAPVEIAPKGLVIEKE